MPRSRRLVVTRILQKTEAGIGERSSMRGFASFPALWLVVLLHVCSTAEATPACEIFITTAEPAGKHFSAELAVSDEERTMGLMGRNMLAEQHGMLFDFGHERRVSMWMKDTLISLDMAFFSQTGRLVYLERATEPLSLRKITPPMPIRYVLEINAGESAGFDPELPSGLDLERLTQCARRSNG